MNLIHNLSKAELAEVCLSFGQPKYRSDQLWQWLYVKKASDWESMKNLPSDLRDKLIDKFSLQSAVTDKIDGNEDETRKVLAKLPDGECVEEVLLVDGDRKTVCVSCQAGCKFKCAFCASGQAGFTRNLEAGEMIGQFLLAEELFNDRINNLVFMGMGEPFDNYDNVMKAARIINNEDGINLGARRITISTCGIVPGIKKMSEEGLQFELSVSLHAPVDELRSRLLPVNKQYPLRELIPVCGDYAEKTGRIITFEYTLIKGVNDSPALAEKLVKLLRPIHCHVNLIPLSPVAEFDGVPPDKETGPMFVELLTDSGTNATLRNSRGSAIKAACGQLRYAEREE